MSKKIFCKNHATDSGMRNFQTQKIAGSEDLDLAKRILCEKFFLVGIIEEFDVFLHVLAEKLKPFHFDVSYSKKNVGSKNRKNRIFEQARQNNKQIIACNALDIELYSFVKNNLVFKQKKLVNVGYDMNAIDFKYRKQKIPLWKIYRNLYYEPLIRILRLYRGLPPSGSY